MEHMLSPRPMVKLLLIAWATAPERMMLNTYFEENNLNSRNQRAGNQKEEEGLEGEDEKGGEEYRRLVRRGFASLMYNVEKNFQFLFEKEIN